MSDFPRHDTYVGLMARHTPFRAPVPINLRRTEALSYPSSHASGVNPVLSTPIGSNNLQRGTHLNTTTMAEPSRPHASHEAQLSLSDFLALVRENLSSTPKPSLLDTFDNVRLALLATGAPEHMGVLALSSLVDSTAKQRIRDLFEDGLDPRAVGALEFLRANIIQGREYNAELMRVHGELVGIHWDPVESIRDLVARIERLVSRHKLIVGGSAPHHNIRELTRVAISSTRRGDETHVRALLECFHDITLMLASDEEFFFTLCACDERHRATTEWTREARARQLMRVTSPTRRKAPPQRSPPPPPPRDFGPNATPISPLGGATDQRPFCTFHQRHGHDTRSCRAATYPQRMPNSSWHATRGSNVSTVSDFNGKMLIDCEVNGIAVRAMIDTGSDVCVINPRLLAKLGNFHTGPLSPPRWFGCADANHFMPSEGQCSVLLRIANVTHITPAVILPQSNFPIILGLHEVQKFFTCTNHNSMSIDIIGGASIPYTISPTLPSVSSIADNVGVWQVVHHTLIAPGVTSLVQVHCTSNHSTTYDKVIFVSDLDERWSQRMDVLCEAVTINEETHDFYVPICNLRGQELNIPAGHRVMHSMPVPASI